MLSLYRLALWLLPPAFRHRFGSALEAEASVRLEEAPGPWGRTTAAIRLAEDLVRTVVREWWDALTHENRMGMGGGMMTDLRWALRALRRTPGFTLTAILTLTLGIGASTVALGLVDAYLLKSLPYPDGERLVSIWPDLNWSQEMFQTAGKEFPSLTDLAATGGQRLVLQEGGEPEEVFAAHATTNLFEVLGVRPVVGRGFLPSDGIPGAEPVTVLSYRVWSERFGSSPDIVGRRIALGGEGHLTRTVIGVMPRDYLALEGSAVAAWVPVVLDPADGDYGNDYFMRAVGRLAPAATLEALQRDVDHFAETMRRIEPSWFNEDRVRGASATPLAKERAAGRRTPVLAALGAALLILLVACANVANLVVARTAGRERELSVRAALGAGRLRTAQTVLLELVLLACAGTLAGVGLAAGLVRLLETRFPEALPAQGLSLDARWVAAAAVLAAFAVIVAGLVPGFHAARRDPARAMAGGRGASGRRGMNRLQEVLSAGQLAMAMAGVAAMTLLGRSLLHLNQVDAGFTTGGGVTFRVTAPPSAYPEDEDVLAFFREARRALAATPGVVEAGFGSRLPLAGGDSRVSVEPEGWEFQEGDPRPIAWYRLASPGYLEALGARLVEGRIPDAGDDTDDGPKLVVVNSAAADLFWPGESPIGKEFIGSGSAVWLTVAGVVADVMENGQAAPVLPGLYTPHRDWPMRTLYAVVRTRENPMAALPELKKAVWSVSSGVPISRVETLERLRDRGLQGTRLLAILAAFAGGVTLLLGGLGVYGVVSQAVGRRLREIGVRAALGADRHQLLTGELRPATRIVMGGLAGGLFLSWLAGRGLQSLLFGVSPVDLPSVAVAVLALATVAYLAALLPARNAARVDPVQVMREE